MLNYNSHFNRKHRIEFGFVVTERGTVINEVKSFPADSVLTTREKNVKQAKEREQIIRNSSGVRSPPRKLKSSSWIVACCGMGRLFLFTKNSRRETAFFEKKIVRQLIIWGTLLEVFPVFSHTLLLLSDFSTVKWITDGARTQMEHYSRKEIMQCKEHAKLKALVFGRKLNNWRFDLIVVISF